MTLMELFVIGKIVKTSGLRGRLKVVSYLESQDALQSFEEVYMRQGKDTKGPFRLKNILVRKNNFLVDVEGVEDVDKAHAFLGCHMLISADKLKKLPEDEYYWRDITGLKVITEDGHVLGTITAVFPTGSNDVYVCSGGEREILLPGISDVVRKIDIKQGVMIVGLLDGL
jgi:16S rRNA processing protein RimM